MDSEDVFERGQTQADIDAKAAEIENFIRKYYIEWYYAIVVYKATSGANYHKTDFDKFRRHEGTNYAVSLSQTKVDDTCKTTKLDNTDIGCEVCDSPYTDCSKAENWIPGFLDVSTHVEEYARNYAEELKKELRKKGYHSCSVWPSAVDYIGWPEDKGTQDTVPGKYLSSGFGTCIGEASCEKWTDTELLNQKLKLIKKRKYFCY